MASLIGLRKRKPSSDIPDDQSASASTTSFYSATQDADVPPNSSVKHIKTASDATTLIPDDFAEPSLKSTEQESERVIETSKPLPSLPNDEDEDKDEELTTLETDQKRRPTSTTTTEISPSIIDHPPLAIPESTLTTTITSAHSPPVTCIRTASSPSPSPSPPRTNLQTKITSLTAQLTTVQSDLSSTYTKLRSHLRRDSKETGNKENQPPLTNTTTKSSQRKTSDASVSTLSSPETGNEKDNDTENQTDKTNGKETPRDSLDDDKATAKHAQGIVNRHIRQLAQYNELKDTALGLMGLIAEERGVLMGNVTKEFGVGVAAKA